MEIGRHAGEAVVRGRPAVPAAVSPGLWGELVLALVRQCRDRWLCARQQQVWTTCREK
jgi:hypothetical protein